MISIILFFLFAVLPVSASPDISLNQTATYTYDDSGRAQVHLEAVLTNIYSHSLPQKYSLYFQGFTPQRIKAVSGTSGILATTLIPNLLGSQAIIDIGSPIPGRGKTNRLEIDYDYLPAEKKGNVWTVNLPRLEPNEIAGKYTIRIIVPPSFGNPVTIAPLPIHIQGNSYYFSKDQLEYLGVNASFGNFTTENFTLTYTKSNKSFLSQDVAIQIPSNSYTQRISYDQMIPKPKNVLSDAMGNWTAIFTLGPRQTLDIILMGQAHLLTNDPIQIPNDYQPSSTNIVSASYSLPISTPLSVEWKKPFLINPFFPLPSKITITNNQTEALSLTPVIFSSSVGFDLPPPSIIPVIPPFGHFDIPLNLTSGLIPKFSSNYIYLQVGSRQITYNIDNNLYLYWNVAFSIIISLGIIALCVAASQAWHIHLQKRQK